MEISSPWVDEVPAASAFAALLLPGAQHVVSYHVVRRGECWAGLADGPPVHLETGDVLVVPQGDPYFMSSAPGLRAGASPDAVLTFFRQMALPSAPCVVIEGGGGPERADMVCGFLGCDVRPFNPVLASLPRLVHLRRAAAAPGRDRVGPLVDFALAESRQGGAGAKCVLLRLSEVLFVEVVRRYLEDLAEGQTGWLAGLRDPLVGQALARLHERPADAWTLDRLARGVGMSRSALADRFTHLMGEPPMRYLTRWRLQLAARLLSEGSAKVSSVALEVGYESEAAFSRAFKKLVGASPAGWRRRAAAGPISSPPSGS
jgi:AraC-like DNA-binding protein